ncbi:MAG: hypothetical protein KAI84_18355, partial [Gammaproteobacteria bacterium]|nr:hypothetical protein [Gammaproteobacteria bacterium]
RPYGPPFIKPYVPVIDSSLEDRSIMEDTHGFYISIDNWNSLFTFRPVVLFTQGSFFGSFLGFRFFARGGHLKVILENRARTSH